jgi:hypothetical protein
MAVTVQSGSSLSATIGVNVGNRGLVELGGGTIVAHDIDIQAGGTLTGEGTVVGKVILGATAGPQEATLSPGITAGHLVVEGEYEQGAGGTLLVDVDGLLPGERDTIGITGSAQLGGTLHVDTSNYTTSTPGATVDIISAGSLAGTFENVVSIGNNDIYFHPVYDYLGGIVSLEQHDRGDMDGRDGITPADFDLFVFGLMNTESSFYSECQCAVGPQQGGDFNGNGRLDFDDIPGFQSQLAGMGMSPDELSAAFQRYFNNVPEPASAWLMLGGLWHMLTARRRRSLGASTGTRLRPICLGSA